MNEPTFNSTIAKIEELTRIEKPAKQTRLKLNGLLTITQSGTYATFSVVFDVPAWVKARLETVNLGAVITQWLENVEWLHDPEHGDFTQARYLASWEKMIALKEYWINRDKEITRELSVKVTWETNYRMRNLAKFFKVSLEVLMVAAVTYEALTRSEKEAPVWNDFQILQAGQQNNSAA